MLRSLQVRNTVQLFGCKPASEADADMGSDPSTLALQKDRTAVQKCAASAAGQPDLQPGVGPTKRCLRCGEERTLFYFPVRTTQPGGWVHCYACQYELRLEVRPFRRCARPLGCPSRT